MTVIVTGGGQVLIDVVEKTLELVLAEVEGVGLGVVVVVVV